MRQKYSMRSKKHGYQKCIQEKASLINVGDPFKKIIIVKDIVNVTRDEDGITTMSIYDFLLKENSLEL